MDAVIGRGPQRAWLEEAVAEAATGRGSLVLLGGDAGVGKTRLVEEVASTAHGTFLRGAARPSSPPYCSVVTALRRYLQKLPDGLEGCGPLRGHLALLLPELGDAVGEGDRGTLFEAIRCSLAAIAAQGPAVVLLDDLQWSDEATLELILEPLSPPHATELAEGILGEPVSPALARALYDRTQGVPFFVEELSAALRSDGRLETGPTGLQPAGDGDVPLPETIRDAVLLRTARLSAEARATAEAAAVTGPRFELDLMEALGCASGLEELMASGLVVERDSERAAFRHKLAREAIYEDIPWLRRRSLHRRLAEALARRRRAGSEVAAHWLAARDPERAPDKPVRATGELVAVHAYRDAARAGRQALELWPDDDRGEERLALLEQHARCAGLAGDLAGAARALREAAAARRAQGVSRALGEAERRLAGIYELQGDRERALASRRVAANAFAADGLPGEAAAERLVAAAFLQSAGKHSEAVDLARHAVEEAARAERIDLRARALALQGVARTKRGERDEGIATVRAGLSLALEHELTAEAAEAYQRLGTA